MCEYCPEEYRHHQHDAGFIPPQPQPQPKAKTPRKPKAAKKA